MAAPVDSALRRHSDALLALAVYTGLALFAFYPAWTRPSATLIGDWRNPDCLSNHWLFQWIPETLRAGGSILHNDRYYFPFGDGPFLAGNGSDALLYAPFQYLLGWPAGLTVYELLLVVAGCSGGYFACRRLGASSRASLFGGAVFGYNPYLLVELSAGRFAQAPLVWMAAFLAAFVAMLERPSARRAATAAVFYAINAFVYWYYGLFATLAGVVLVAVFAVAHRRQIRPRLLSLALFSGIAAGLLAWPLALFFKRWQAIPGVEEAFPSPWSVVTSRLPGWPVWEPPRLEGVIVVPAAALLLAVVAMAGAVRRRSAAPGPGVATSARPAPEALVSGRSGDGCTDVDPGVDPRHSAASGTPTARAQSRESGACVLPASDRWKDVALVVVALVFFLLSLGPWLKRLNGPPYEGFPLPFYWLYGLAKPLERFWWPTRHVVLVYFAVGALAARALTGLEPRLPRALTRLVPLALTLLLPVDLALRGAPVRVDQSAWTPPKPYVALREQPGDVLLELPIAPDVVTTQQSLLYQPLHGKRLIGGHSMWVRRVRPAGWDTWLEANTFLAALASYERGNAGESLSFEAKDLLELRERGMRIVTVNRELYPEAFRDLYLGERSMMWTLFGPPVLTGDHFQAFDTARWTGTRVVKPARFHWPGGLPAPDGNHPLPLLTFPSPSLERVPYSVAERRSRPYIAP